MEQQKVIDEIEYFKAQICFMKTDFFPLSSMTN